MARPRKVSDDQVFAAAQRVMSRVGPAEFTLEEIAREAGVTAGALVQRFGSKRGLLVTISAAMAEGTPNFLEQFRAQYRSPLRAIRAYAECMGDLAESPTAFIRNLAYLQNDLADPDLRASLERHAYATRAALEVIIKDAVAAGELSESTKAAPLAKTIETILSGSLMTWAIYQEGKASKWIRDDVDRALTPYRISRQPKKDGRGH